MTLMTIDCRRSQKGGRHPFLNREIIARERPRRDGEGDDAACIPPILAPTVPRTPTTSLRAAEGSGTGASAVALLGVDALILSTKAPDVEREAYFALLIEALAERVAKAERYKALK